MSLGKFGYWIFISYAHQDYKLAQRLRRKLAGFKANSRVRICATDLLAAETNGRVFFESEDMVKNGKDLPTIIKSEMVRSQKIVVICSPSSADPDCHVNLELNEFIRLGN